MTETLHLTLTIPAAALPALVLTGGSAGRPSDDKPGATTHGRAGQASAPAAGASTSSRAGVPTRGKSGSP